MNLKPFNSQISIFLSDGIMNPIKFIDKFNVYFENLFTKEDYLLKIDAEGIPDEVPLFKYSSSDGKYSYDFAKKRINFYLNFDENDSMDLFEEYKTRIKNVISSFILEHSSISRIGIAINYYIDKKDEKCKFWAEKYRLPFYDSKKTCVISYNVNNNFTNRGIKYNDIISLSDAKIRQTKVVPVVSIDVNNVPVDDLSSDDLNYIFDEINNYKLDVVEGIINK